jgi:chemotaxis protein MotB
MPKETWTIAAILTIGLLLGLLVFASCDKKALLDRAQAELAEAKQTEARNAAETAALREKLTAAEDHLQELAKEKEAVEKNHQSLEDEMRAALESKDVTISQLQGKLTVNILDRILFDSGEADLKPDGAAVLRKVAAILEQHTNLLIQVVGHTDNVPIRPGARTRFPSNWELSTARATAAVRFLSEKAGIDPRRLGALGYGEFRPVADNSTADGRAKNRRIAIMILPEQLAVPEGPLASARLRQSAPPALEDAALSTNAALRLAPLTAPVETPAPAQ